MTEEKLLTHIAHPLGAGPDRRDNLKRAARWCVWAAKSGVAPEATWIVLASIWGETPENRDLGLECDCVAVGRCDQVWLVGGRVSPGMKIEAEHARGLGIPVYDFTMLGEEPPNYFDQQARLDIARAESRAKYLKLAEVEPPPTIVVERESFNETLSELRLLKKRNQQLLEESGNKKMKERGLNFLVKLFHEKFGFPFPEKAVKLINQDWLKQRLRLITEEYFEVLGVCAPERVGPLNSLRDSVLNLIRADAHLMFEDFPKFIHELADLDYTVEGTRVTFGVDGWPIACVVHHANMNKEPGQDKPTKPEDWEPADVAKELRLQGFGETP